MAWERIRHWQWLVVAVVIGVVVVVVRGRYADDAIKAYGESLNGQGSFEAAVLRTIRGHHQFENLTVTPELIDDGAGGRRFVHVVRGMYWDGRVSRGGDAPQAAWAPAFFVAPVPYRPVLEPKSIGAAAAARVAAAMPAGANTTVLDFLSAAGKVADGGVDYHYAWYRGSGYAMWMWVGGCVLLIGIGLPVVINLTVFGTVWRPRMEKEAAADLSKVAPVPAAAPKVVSETEQARLRELEREMEERLAGGDTTAPVAGAVAAKAAPAVTKLNAGKLEPAAATQEGRQVDYGADKDDFYPTERRGRH
jgi:hypothetical protein